jgi:hypothetical protein
MQNIVSIYKDRAQYATSRLIMLFPESNYTTRHYVRVTEDISSDAP